ncbi:hypothetical protein QBC42DRAFT_272554 [Cladorrhinum samala]|uniref:Secreted protein n=1 Tax=Cladorrhinum samala TaxID=585594 RepID=A0AAV9HI22_9PEZI|nr:hypothetical protein QBC42DRAFT_272554 [Cladorrhinum samala]
MWSFSSYSFCIWIFFFLPFFISSLYPFQFVSSPSPASFLQKIASTPLPPIHKLMRDNRHHYYNHQKPSLRVLLRAPTHKVMCTMNVS